MSTQRPHGQGPGRPPDDMTEQWNPMDYENFEEVSTEWQGYVYGCLRLHVILLSIQGGTAITADLAQNERAVHLDFFNGKA